MVKRVLNGVKNPSDSDVITISEIDENRKCLESYEYFLENYVKVQHPTLGSVLFKQYQYQKRVLKEVHENAHTIILQPRQSGKSANIVAYILWLTCFFPDKKIGIASNKLTGAKDLLSRFKYSYEELPAFLKPSITSYNIFGVDFDNGSSVISVATTASSFRGMSMSLIFLDELAFVNERVVDQFWTSLLPSITAGGSGSAAKLIITSTPSGSEGLFAELWFGAEQGLNGFTSVRVYNEEVEGRDINFKKKMLQKMSEEKWNQEYECQFISSKGTLIASTFLEKLRPLEPISKRGDLEIFRPIEDKRLGIAVDVGTGAGQDFSVIQIFDLDNLEQVAQYRNNKLTLSEFTVEFLSVLTYLKRERRAKEIYYTIESNSIGQGILTLIDNSRHPILKEAEFVNETSTKKGILTTTKSKLKGCMKFKDLVESGRMTLHSRKLFSELRFFVKSGVSFKAETGMTDDLVMGCVVFTNMLAILAYFDAGIYDKITKTGFDLEMDEEGEVPIPIVF